ncbi:MAG: cupredoxin domain-containing protein [Nitriliruptoraceae bacterium]|nr:cupredoxin domain-containing protein [Nitriliruptoraceae bacterium]
MTRRRRPTRPIAVLAALALFALGCDAEGEVEEDDADLEQLDEDAGDDPDLEPDDETDPEAGGEDDPVAQDGLGVLVEDNRFAPESIVAQVGDTIEWEHTGSNPHTVTGEDFDSGSMSSGDTFEFTFDEPGTYTYTCEIHGGMDGEVIIEG